MPAGISLQYGQVTVETGAAFGPATRAAPAEMREYSKVRGLLVERCDKHKEHDHCQLLEKMSNKAERPWESP